LLYLNGSLITENERRDAELAYIKFICEQTKSGSVEFSENVFPRLEALKNHYADYFSGNGPNGSLAYPQNKLSSPCRVK